MAVNDSEARLSPGFSLFSFPLCEVTCPLRFRAKPADSCAERLTIMPIDAGGATHIANPHRPQCGHWYRIDAPFADCLRPAGMAEDFAAPMMDSN